LINIFYVYLAIWIVVLIHETGHFPKRIQVTGWIIPNAVAIEGKYRIGGLIANVIMFTGIYLLNPQSMILKLVGLMAWGHFILYSIFGSIVPEPNINKVKSSSYVFDDVDNKLWPAFFAAVILAYIFFGAYYINIFRGLL
jgi:hypothetical protein